MEKLLNLFIITLRILSILSTLSISINLYDFLFKADPRILTTPFWFWILYIFSIASWFV
jgi:hypothetical protein